MSDMFALHTQLQLARKSHTGDDTHLKMFGEGNAYWKPME
jgi:hypothetical protein